MRTAGVLSLLLLSGCSSAPIPWGTFTDPAPGEPEPIGSYAAGCIRGAVALPDVATDGYLIMRPERRRWFGHPSLIAFIQEMGKALRPKGLLGVGDLSQPRGGPMKTGHRSHQVGLDVDLWYGLPKGTSTASREKVSAKKVVTDPFVSKLNPLFTKFAETAVRTAALHPEVERIFVTPAVKDALCKRWSATTDQALLQKLRPWWGHDDHFHVRLRCPPGGPCEAQEASPPGNGCDDTLSWWFSAEAREMSMQKSTEKWDPDKVKVPAACRALAPEPPPGT